MARVVRHARAVAILVSMLGSAIIVGPHTAGAETALQAWERVEALKQTAGAAGAREESRSAVESHPEFLPLVTQLARIRAASGGFAAVQALADSLRAEATRAQARAAAIFLALERGSAQAALDTLVLLPPAPRGSPAEAFRDLDLAIAALGAGQTDRADSLLVELDGQVAFGPGRFVSRYLQVFLRQPRASLEFQRGRTEDAIAIVAAATEDAERQGFLDLRMRMLHLLGRFLAATGRSEQAVIEYRKALEMARSLNDDWQLATTSSWLAWALEQQRRFGEAFDLRQEGMKLFPRMGDPLGMAYTLLGLGWDALRVGRMQLAEDTLLQAIDFARTREWTWMEAQALLNLGALFSEQGEFDLSLQALQRALALAEQTHNESQRSGVLNNLAVLHLRMDRPDRAIAIYEKLLAIHRANGDLEAESAVLNNMALASENMGNTAQARVLYERCLQLSIDHGRPDNAARINLGRVLAYFRLWKESEGYLRAAIEDAAARRSTADLADAQAELGRCLSFQGRMQEASRHLEAADSVRVATGVVGLRVPDLIRLALVRFALERWHEGITALDEAQELAIRVAPSQVAIVHSLRAFAKLALGETEAARNEARLAEETAQDPSVRELAPYVSQIASIAAISALLRSARGTSGTERHEIVEETFGMLQRVQARSLLEYVQGGQQRIEPDVPDSLIRRERRARRTVDEIRHLIDDAGANSNLDSLRVALAEAQAVQNQLRTLVFRSDRRYRDVALPPRFETDALDRIVDTRTLILDYVTGRDCEAQFPCDAYLFAVDADGIEVYPLGQTSKVNRQVGLLTDLLSDPTGVDDDTVRLLLGELGRTLLGPVADRVQDYETIVVVPDGLLARLPFAALLVPPTSSSPTSVHLVELASIETIPSLAVLHQLRERDDDREERDPRWDIAIWRAGTPAAASDSIRTRGFDLPHADDELSSLRSLMPRSTLLDVDLDDEPELAEQLSELPAWRSSEILHFIAHGYFDDLQPWRSGLYLQPPAAGGEPRKLEIADVYRMSLTSRLVTLSACDTARGDTNAGVGFLGFTQALLGSGATSVLATLWSIDDASTPRFMTWFYEGLGEGLSGATALRRAQIRCLADGRLSHPYYWAPYVLLGDGSRHVTVTLHRPSPLTRPIVLLASGLVLLLAGLWVRTRGHRA